MVFSSFFFLLLFLPFTILTNYLLPKRFRIFFLLLVSLVFYYYGEKQLSVLLFFSIIWNYVSGILISKGQKDTEDGNSKTTKVILSVSVIGNLLLLGYYKYFVFILDSLGLSSYFTSSYLSGIVMPIGISFFTFHGISYVVDIYRREAVAVKSIIDMGLYIAFFPQLIAGPIIKYHDVDTQLKSRTFKVDDIQYGINRFIRGLAKKIILANNFALVADSVFNGNISDSASPTLWFGILCYTLQIYYDFSGYSDMAIGLGKMMGFHFKENFNYPYIAKSIQDFWRRWHISLSTWFKEYVYIPLGGNRKGKGRMLFHLLTVFVLTGFWHGASFNFLIWGLIHGLFIILEKLPFPKLSRKFQFLRHMYVVIVVLFSWVFFRVVTLPDSLLYIKKLVLLDFEGSYYPFVYFSPYFTILFLAGIIFVTPLRLNITHFINRLGRKQPLILNISKSILYLLLLVFTVLELSSLTYNPFIYFRF